MLNLKIDASRQLDSRDPYFHHQPQNHLYLS
jgi:hypothetical protein